MPLILGISAFYHDSAAAILRDGQLVAAAQEERFTRQKHDPGFPGNAIAYCLTEAKATLDDVDHIAFYDKPFLTFERLLETYLGYAPRGYLSFSKALPVWVKDKLFQKRNLAKSLEALGARNPVQPRLLFAEHHESHAASAFYPSPFDRAAVLTMDGVGEWATTTRGVGHDNALTLTHEIVFPHSLGLLYSAFTYYAGFRVNSGEYKVMGLAPYGAPTYAGTILENLIDLKEDGSFRMNMDYFAYPVGLRMTNAKFDALMGAPARKLETEPLDQRHMDLAASIQAVTEEIVLRLGRSIARDTGERNLCLAGGVALNCVANGKLLRDRAFDNIWVQPAAGDAGGAVGAAYAAHHGHLGQPRPAPGGRDAMRGAYLGPGYSQDEIERRLTAEGARYTRLDDDALIESVVDGLCKDNAIGWMQGRMEFGPRALGARSIIGDPRSPAMQKTLNLKIKYRESFRPFAPAVLADDVAEYFEFDGESPYMLMVADVLDRRRLPMTAAEKALFGINKLNVARSDIPAITHVDYSARIQTVHADTNPAFHALLSRFKARTGCAVLVNTSFNVRGEPIVCTPQDGFRCFMGTEMDMLVIGNAVLHKEDQDPALARDYKDQFEPD